MAAYYFDTSALVKRYAQEAGTAWVMGLTALAAGHDLYILNGRMSLGWRISRRLKKQRQVFWYAHAPRRRGMKFLPRNFLWDLRKRIFSLDALENRRSGLDENGRTLRDTASVSIAGEGPLITIRVVGKGNGRTVV